MATLFLSFTGFLFNFYTFFLSTTFGSMFVIGGVVFAIFSLFNKLFKF